MKFKIEYNSEFNRLGDFGSVVTDHMYSVHVYIGIVGCVEQYTGSVVIVVSFSSDFCEGFTYDETSLTCEAHTKGGNWLEKCFRGISLHNQCESKVVLRFAGCHFKWSFAKFYFFNCFVNVFYVKNRFGKQSF